MPLWVYNVPPLVLALLMVVTIAGVSLVGLPIRWIYGLGARPWEWPTGRT